MKFLPLLILLLCGQAWGQNVVPGPGCSLTGCTITPATNSLSPALTTSQSGAGTLSAAYAFNHINITADVINAAAAPSGSQVADGLQVSIAGGGTGMTGNRVGVEGSVHITQAPTTAGNYVGLWGLTQLDVNLGGTSGTPAGNAFGSNPQVNVLSTATYLTSAVGEEIDINTAAAVANRFGLNVVSFTTSDVQGTVRDAAITIGGGNWNYAFNLTGYNSGGAFPLATTGTVMGSDVAGTVNYGINFANLTCTDACYISAGFSDNGAGLTATFSTTGNAQTYLDSASGSTAYAYFGITGTQKWYIGNNTVNQFVGWDNTNSGSFILVSSGGATTIGESGKSLTINGTVVESGLATSGSGGGIYMCVDTAGNVYKKSACP